MSNNQDHHLKQQVNHISVGSENTVLIFLGVTYSSVM